MFKAPPYLKKNDKVAIVAPAKNFNSSELAPAVTILESWGLKVVLGKNVFKSHNQFAGTDEERLQDLQSAFDDESIKAIFCVRGGYGTNRIIDKLNFKNFLKNPKWVTGFSDVTVLHSHIHNKKVQSIHSIMPLSFGKKDSEDSVSCLKDTLFGETVSHITTPNKLNRIGNATAPVIGGNISIISSLIGTPSDIDTKGKILFIEDIDEYLYRIDRMIIHLKRAGKLSKLKGLIVGHMSDMKDGSVPFGKDANEIIAEAVKEYKYPVCYNFPVGHEPQNFPMICGRTAQLNVGEEKVELKFK